MKNTRTMKQTAVEWLIKELEEQKLIKLDKLSTILFHKNFATRYELIVNQAKEMEKQQMCDFADFVATYSDKNKNVNGEMLHAKSKYDGAERTIDLLKEYKNNESNVRI